MKRKRLALLPLLVVVVLLLSPQSQAAFSGDPVGGLPWATDNLGTCRWTSTLDRNPACQMETCIWIDTALEAQGYTESEGWTITTAADLAGSITIAEYYAWVTTKPEVTFDGKTWPTKGPANCFGGAVLVLSYWPGEGDPTGDEVHWIQAISTNCPLDHGLAHGYEAGDGYYWYLDNSSDVSVPFYPELAANSTGFFDRPCRPCPDDICPCGGSCDWEAQVFVAKWNSQEKEITIYEDGIWWGFDLVCIPEPATMSLLALGGLALLYRRRSA